MNKVSQFQFDRWMLAPALDRVFDSGLKSAIPEGELTISRWAEQYRHVSQDRVADPALAGRWKNSTTPYLVGIMDAVTEPDVNEIIFLKSSQVGGTEAINNIIGYYIHIDPATIQYICENEGKARAWSVESFAPMIRDTPVLADIFGEARTRDSTNMIESKQFRGGHFALGWATSPATLSSRPRRIILTDETDAFEPTNEGDPIKLAEARTKTAGSQRKLIHVTTPRNKETSRIFPMWENSTQEKYFVPCPGCDEFQVLEWKNVKWDDGEQSDAYMVCIHCGVLIENSDKFSMIARGEWRITNLEYKGNRRGFWICELYSPFTTWGEMAEAFLEAKLHRDTLKVFINTRLAEFWEEKDDEIEFEDLLFSREDYGAEIPDGVMVLTAGVDVQDDRLEIEVVGWGKDYESWSIDYKVIEGSPGLYEVWDDLEDYLLSEFQDASGKIFKIRAACVDTGGHHTTQVYKFCKANAGRRWMAIKGSNQAAQPIAPRNFKIVGKIRARLYHIGTDTAKDEIFAYLKNTNNILRQLNETKSENIQSSLTALGYCHFPADREKDYFKQLCSEKKTTKYTMGAARKVYEKISQSIRNEPLDCRVYATAARAIVIPNYEKFVKRHIKESAPRENDVQEENRQPRESQTEENSGQNKIEFAPNKKSRVVVKNKITATKKGGNFATDW